MPLLTITAPGYYAVTADYTATSATDNAVEVLPGVHNVIILLYGRLISPLFSTAQQNAGINFNGSNSCQVIGMGGHIRGFGYGLRAENCDDLGVSQIYVKDALMRGIRISGDDAYVKDCRVSDVHGSTFSPNQYCFGIEVDGARPTIAGNSVREFWGPARARGSASRLPITPLLRCRPSTLSRIPASAPRPSASGWAETATSISSTTTPPA